jgi:hypothetical protein
MVEKEFKVDFFVVGAARSGTTTLYQYLSQHSEVYLPKVKELNYFSKVSSNQVHDYDLPKPEKEYHTKIIQSAEVYKSLYASVKPGQIKGDISPSYLWHEETAAAIKAHNPQAKIVVTLRHPIERAFSHYLMAKSVGYEKNKNFEQATHAPLSEYWGGGNRYLEWSDYIGPLKAYYAAFPKKQIHVMIFEQWVRDQESALSELADFLGVEHQNLDAFGDQHNQTLAYKRQATLNAMRTPWARTILHALMGESMRNRIKDLIFGGGPSQELLSEDLKNRLINQNIESLIQLEQLIQKPILELWGVNKR